VSSSDFLASYNLNPLLHPSGSKEAILAASAGESRHKTFSSALVRLNYDPSAYSAKGLLARGIGVDAACGGNEPLPRPPAGSGGSPKSSKSAAGAASGAGAVASFHYTPGYEVEFFPCGDGRRRDVSTQRTTFLLEAAINEVAERAGEDRGDGKPPKALLLDLATLTMRSPRLRALEGWRFSPALKDAAGNRADCGTGGTPLWKEHQSRIGAGPASPFTPGRGIKNRAEFLGAVREVVVKAKTPPPMNPPSSPYTPRHLATPGTGRKGPPPPLIPTVGPRAGQTVVLNATLGSPLAGGGGGISGSSVKGKSSPQKTVSNSSAKGSTPTFSSIGGSSLPFPSQGDTTRTTTTMTARIKSTPSDNQSRRKSKGDSFGVTAALDWESSAHQGLNNSATLSPTSTHFPGSMRDPHEAPAMQPRVAVTNSVTGAVNVRVSGAYVPAYELEPLPPAAIEGLRAPPGETPPPPRVGRAAEAREEVRKALEGASFVEKIGQSAAIAERSVSSAEESAFSSSPHLTRTPIPRKSLLSPPVAMTFNTKTWRELSAGVAVAGLDSDAIAAHFPPPKYEKYVPPPPPPPKKEGGDD